MPERSTSRWLGLAAGVVAVAALAFAVVSVYPMLRYSGYTVAGESMAPTIEAGGRVRAESFDGEARPGELVLLRLPGTDRNLVVKRVVAVGGQRVSAAGGRLLVNGEPLDEPYLGPGVRTDVMRPLTVPARTVYVLGDNRQRQVGSNFTDVGPVPLRDVEQRVVDTDPPATIVQIAYVALGVAVAVVAGLLCRRWLRQSGRSRSSASTIV